MGTALIGKAQVRRVKMRRMLAAIMLIAAAITLPAHRQTASAILMPMGDATNKRTLKRADYMLTDAVGGVRFDLDGDGIEEQTGWTATGSGLAFLALDRNGNGKIDNGKELFGNFARPDSSNGFAALLHEAGPYGAYGAIEEGHRLFEKLLLWEDENHNGLSDAGEIQKFSDHYVFIDLSWVPDALKDKHGSDFRYTGNAGIRVSESKKLPRAKMVCDEGPFGTLRNCKPDRSDELSRYIDIYDVFFVQR